MSNTASFLKIFSQVCNDFAYTNRKLGKNIKSNSYKGL